MGRSKAFPSDRVNARRGRCRVLAGVKRAYRLTPPAALSWPATTGVDGPRSSAGAEVRADAPEVARQVAVADAVIVGIHVCFGAAIAVYWRQQGRPRATVGARAARPAHVACADGVVVRVRVNAGAVQVGTREPGSEIDVTDNGLTGAAGIGGVGRPGRAAPPVASGVLPANM